MAEFAKKEVLNEKDQLSDILSDSESEIESVEDQALPTYNPNDSDLSSDEIEEEFLMAIKNMILGIKPSANVTSNTVSSSDWVPKKLKI